MHALALKTKGEMERMEEDSEGKAKSKSLKGKECDVLSEREAEFETTVLTLLKCTFAFGLHVL